VRRCANCGAFVTPDEPHPHPVEPAPTIEWVSVTHTVGMADGSDYETTSPALVVSVHGEMSRVACFHESGVRIIDVPTSTIGDHDGD
jgi:hypothetical protein